VGRNLRSTSAVLRALTTSERRTGRSYADRAGLTAGLLVDTAIAARGMATASTNAVMCRCKQATAPTVPTVFDVTDLWPAGSRESLEPGPGGNASGYLGPIMRDAKWL